MRIHDESVSKPQPHALGLRVPRGIHPKRRKKRILGQLRKYLGEIFRESAEQRGCQIVEDHLMAGHVHTCISIPPKYSVASVVGTRVTRWKVIQAVHTAVSGQEDTAGVGC